MNGPVELWSLTERFDTEAEALTRVRELRQHDPSLALFIRDGQGRLCGGLSLQLRAEDGSAADR